jgi:hypothetical protein
VVILRIEDRGPAPGDEADPELATLAVYPGEGGEALFTCAVILSGLERLIAQARAGDAPTGEDVHFNREDDTP